MNPKDGAPAPAQDVKDDDFVVESASVAFEPAPADTTGAGVAAAEAAETAKAAQAAAAAPVDGTGGDEDEEEAPPAAQSSGEVSASAATQAERDAAGRFTKGGKKDKTLEGRVQTLKKEVDTLTYQKHQTVGEQREAERRLTELRGQIAEAEKKLNGGASPAPTAGDKPVPGTLSKDAATAATAPPPKVPSYRDFATDDEYETAMAKYSTDVVEWQTAREKALKDEITGAIDQRLKGKDAESAAQADEVAFMTRLDAVRSKDPNWGTKVQALATVRSSWHNPEKHGTVYTPFLSDMVRHHTEEGPQLLAFLAEDVERAQVLADLIPSRSLRDVLVSAPSILPLFKHFATEQGQKDFAEIKAMQPLRAGVALGALSARLAVPSGSASAASPITKAQPPAKPPVGQAVARGAAPANRAESFDDWNAAEDAKELAHRLRLAGVSAPA